MNIILKGKNHSDYKQHALQGGNIVNLISNIMIKDNDGKKSSVDNKRAVLNQDHGFSIYKALEFSKDNSIRASHNQYMEMICNRLV